MIAAGSRVRLTEKVNARPLTAGLIKRGSLGTVESVTAFDDGVLCVVTFDCLPRVPQEMYASWGSDLLVEVE